ncbi:MAG: hypothetical protein U9Q30_01260, partial [Campylobacterota bacterium]|nr:hypothetical protein [Campylobacterota bacterium]
MFKVIFIISLLFSSILGSINELDKKINLNKDIYDDVVKSKYNIDKNINELAQNIKKNENAYDEILKKLDEANEKIILNKLKLEKAKQKIG